MKSTNIIILDNIRSLNNIGSVFRTCDAFNIKKIFLCGICGTPPNKEIHKTALGSTSSVDWRYFKTTKEALSILKNNKYVIIAVEQAKESVLLNDFSCKEEKIALIFGNEVKGVSEECINLSDEIIEINQHGIKKSMNVSVTAGIILWAIVNK